MGLVIDRAMLMDLQAKAEALSRECGMDTLLRWSYQELAAAAERLERLLSRPSAPRKGDSKCDESSQSSL